MVCSWARLFLYSYCCCSLRSVYAVIYELFGREAKRKKTRICIGTGSERVFNEKHFTVVVNGIRWKCAQKKTNKKIVEKSQRASVSVDSCTGHRIILEKACKNKKYVKIVKFCLRQRGQGMHSTLDCIFNSIARSIQTYTHERYFASENAEGYIFFRAYLKCDKKRKLCVARAAHYT